MSAGDGPIVCRTVSEEQTIALGMALAESVRAGDVVAIDGELGAGKTRLVRGIAMGLGVSPGEVRSPTYALAHEYTPAPGRPRVVHVDAYRLSGPDDLESIGWDRIAGSDAVVVVEWAERVAPSLPTDRFSVRIAHAGEDVREITIACPAGRDAKGARGYAALVAGRDSGQRKCRACGRVIDTSIETFPFCSMRCRQADLGAWFSEKYRISRDVTERDLDEG